MSEMFDLVVIGAGSGGIAAARRAAKHGVKVAIIENSRLGGTCVNLGCVPKKVMWNAANLYGSFGLMKSYGINISGVEHDWLALKTRRDAYVKRLNNIYENNLSNDGIQMFKGTGKIIGQGQVQVNADIINAKNILIATGSHANVPEIPGSEFGVTSDGFFDLEELPKRVAIVGAGYIATELAGILNAFGSEVSLFCRHSHVLRHFDSCIQDYVMAEMEKSGIRFIKHSFIQSIEKDSNLSVQFKESDKLVEEHFDSVIYAIGRSANHSYASQSFSLDLNDNGFVKVNEKQETSQRNVFALGDVCGEVMLTPVAIAAGRKLSDRLFAGKTKVMDYSLVASVVFTHPPSAAIGVTEQESKNMKDIKIYTSKFTNMLYALSEEKHVTFYKLIVQGPAEKIVGLHMVGEGSDEIMQGFAVAIKMGATKEDFDNTVAIRPTSAEEIVTMK